MKVSVQFTEIELRLLSRALTLGLIHTDKEDESQRMAELERKIQMLGALANER